MALRRVVRLGADWLPLNMTPEELAGRRRDLAELLEGPARRVRTCTHGQPHRRPGGRRPGARYAEAGADQLLVNFRRKVNVDNLEAALDELAGAFGLESPSAG